MAAATQTPRPYSFHPESRKKGRRYDNLYPKERLFMKQLKGGKTMQQAALTAYSASSPRVASQIANRVVRRDRFLKALEDEGMSARELARYVKRGLGSTKPVVVGKQLADYPDFAVVLNYLKLILKSQGILADKEDPNDASGEPLILKSVIITQNNLTIKRGSEPETQSS